MPHRKIKLENCDNCPSCKGLSGFKFMIPAKVKIRGFWGGSMDQLIEDSAEYSLKKTKTVVCIDCLKRFEVMR